MWVDLLPLEKGGIHMTHNGQKYFFNQPHASSSLPTKLTICQPTYASQPIAIFEPSLSRSIYKNMHETH